MATTYLQRLRQFNRNTRLLLLAYTSPGFCYFGISAVLLNLYLLRLGYGPEFIGVFTGVGFLVLTLACLPAGAIGLRWGSRRAMIAGMVLDIAGQALLLASELLPPGLRAGWLVTVNAISYAGGALWLVNGMPFLAGSTSDEERGHAFSIQAAVMPLGGFAGSLVGGFLPGLLASSLGLSLDDAAPYRFSILIAVALYGAVSLPALLATHDLHDSQTREKQTGLGSAPYALIAVLALYQLLRASGGYGSQIFFNVYLDAGLRVPTSLVGALSAVGQLIAVPAALAAPLLMARLGKPRTVVWASLGMVASLLPLALVAHWGAAGLGFTGMVAAAAIADTAAAVFGQELVEPRWRALISAASMTAFSLGSSAASFGGGYIIAALGYRSLFLVGAGVVLAGAMLFWVVFRGPRGQMAPAPMADSAKGIAT